MESERSVKIEEACRFCWMCRHLCPVALMTGNEANTPRGRALVSSMDRRGFPLGKGSAEKMVECVLCYACADNCATGYDPTVFTRDIRGRAIAENLVDGNIKKLAAELLQGKNPFGEDGEDKEFDAFLKTLDKQADVLVFRSGYRKHALPLLKLLQRAEVSFTTKEDEPVSGALACDFMGYISEVKTLAENWAKWLNESGAQTVVCLDPEDVFFLREQMSKWDIKVKPEVVTAVGYVSGLCKEGKLELKKNKLTVIYHDPSRMARNISEIEEPRLLLRESGADVKELFLHGHLARSSGSIILAKVNHDLQRKVATGLWEDIKVLGIDTVVTASPESCCNLERDMPDGMIVKDLFALL